MGHLQKALKGSKDSPTIKNCISDMRIWNYQSIVLSHKDLKENVIYGLKLEATEKVFRQQSRKMETQGSRQRCHFSKYLSNERKPAKCFNFGKRHCRNHIRAVASMYNEMTETKIQLRI